MALATLFETIDPPPDATPDTDAAEAPRTENALGQSARDALVLRMVASGRCRAEARNFARSIGKENEADDFESVAFLACVNAARFFDQAANANTAFETYATSWIRRSLTREAANLDAAVSMDCWETVADHRAEADTEAADEPAGGDVGQDDDGSGYVNEGHGERESGDRKPNGEQLVILSKLPAAIRDVVRLCVFECFTPDQIAARLNMATKDVKLAIRNAGKTIEKFMRFDDAPHLFADQFEQAWPEDSHAC